MKIVARTKNLIHSCLMLACTNTLAQSTDQGVEEIIVVAHRLPVPSSKVASSVSVLTQEDIAEYGNLSIKDILRQTPGVASTSNGGMGATSSLRIRGEEGFRTLVLFDGIRLSDPSATQVATPIEHILSDGIGQVEIIRGPQGLNFGADAGGIIALSSQTNEEGLNTSLEAQSGKFGTSQGNLNISGSNGSSDFSIFASQINTDGFNARSDDNILMDDDGYENSTIHLRARTKLTDQIRIQAVHRNVEGDSEYDGCFLQTTIHDCESEYELEASRLSIDYNSETLTHSLGFSKTETDRKFFSADELGFSSAGELNRIEYIGSLNQFDSFSLIYGFDLEEEINGKMERDNEGYYLEFLSNFSDKLTISGGVRRDENDDFGGHTSHRITGAYLFDWTNLSVKFKTSYGSGFRAPSLYEIDYNSGPWAFPPASNTQLQEEKSEGYEYGFEFLAHDKLSGELIVFDQEIDDAIYFDLAGYSGYLQETGKSKSTGIEVNGSYILSDSLTFKANYTYNDTERPNGLQRLRRPEKLGNIGINYQNDSGKLRLNSFYRMSKNSIDERFGSLIGLDDFEVLDISISYKITPEIEIFARIENVLDEKYEEVIGYLTPRRGSYLGFRINI